MREVYEFRVSEERAGLLFRPGEGTRLGEHVRKIRITPDDPRFQEIGRLQHEVLAKGAHHGYFFAGWAIHRRYSASELEAAELFLLEINAVFEPAGEECGTIYDESQVCPHCGVGWKQVSDLTLDLRKAPKSKAIACTIADEVIVSQRLAEAMAEAGTNGAELRPVRHKARYEDDAIDLTKVPSGQELLRRAEAAGAPYETSEFYVWLNREEQKELFERAEQEHVSMATERAARRKNKKPLPVWYQPVYQSRRVSIANPTRFGINPFDEDPEGEYRCPLGHVSGLNRLSEVSVSRESWDGSDIACTVEMEGTRRGLLRPRPLILVSKRFCRMLNEVGGRGYDIEVAHLV